MECATSLPAPDMPLRILLPCCIPLWRTQSPNVELVNHEQIRSQCARVCPTRRCGAGRIVVEPKDHLLVHRFGKQQRGVHGLAYAGVNSVAARASGVTQISEAWAARETQSDGSRCAERHAERLHGPLTIHDAEHRGHPTEQKPDRCGHGLLNDAQRFHILPKLNKLIVQFCVLTWRWTSSTPAAVEVQPDVVTDIGGDHRRSVGCNLWDPGVQARWIPWRPRPRLHPRIWRRSRPIACR